MLLPAFNAGATIRAALTSIQRQTAADWECIVIDDGSHDDTPFIVEALAAADPRIRLLRQSHKGLVPALNEGLGHCKGQLVARMDADDLMHRGRLWSQAAMLAADPELSAVGCHVRIFPRASMSARLAEYEAWLNGLRSHTDVARDAFVECPVAHPSLMMRREVAFRFGYRHVGWPEDYDLVLRMLGCRLHIGIVAKRLLCWRNRADSLSRTSAAYSIEQFTACKAHYLAHGFLAQADTYVLWGYGSTGRQLRRALASHGKTPSHIVEVKTTRIGQRIHDAPVIPIESLPELRGQPIVVSVAREAPRSEIRTAMARMAFVEGVDFVCAA